MTELFFGASTGRCGSITLANLINSESGVGCLHEGLIRQGTDVADQWLPSLNLQNKIAYHQPEKALALFKSGRGTMVALAHQKGLGLLGDISFRYAPFVSVIPKVYPSAKLMVIVRDGRDFVRSAYVTASPDPMPMGWPDNDKPLTKLEQFIGLGRLCPKRSGEKDSQWRSLNPVQKNSWLWAETNRIIFEGLKAWDEGKVLVLRFEDMMAAPAKQYEIVRDFLGIRSPWPDTFHNIVDKKLNHRAAYALPVWRDWSADVRKAFDSQASDMMHQLGYY